MATRTRPFVLTGAALASAAAVVLATPNLIPSSDLSIASSPTPTRLATANYELTAISDITIQGLNDAYWFGWGGFIENDDPYYPGVAGSSGIYASGFSGALYYLIDNALDEFGEVQLDNYYFEIGWLNGGNPNSPYSGLGAVLYVGATEAFGEDSPVAQAAKAIFYYGVTSVVNSTIVAITSSIVPEIDLGPITVGGGILASLYFFGQTPDGEFNYGAPGLSAIWSYVSTSLTGLLAPAAAAPAATTLAAPAATTGAPEVSKSVAGELKSDLGAGDENSNEKADATETAPAAGSKLTAITAASAVANASVATTTTESATDVDLSAGTTATEATDTTTTAGGSTTSTESGSSAEASVAAGAAESAASTDTKAPTGSTGKPGKHRAQSPLSKITDSIKSALGGKSSSSSSSSTSDSSSSDSSSSTSSSDK